MQKTNIIKENMSDKNIIKLKKVFEKKPSHPNIIVNNIIASSEKTLIALNKNNTISILDLYPIQELKIKFQRRFKKRKTEFLTFGVLRKDSNAITTQISIDNNSSPLKLCKNEHFAIATNGLTFEKLYILNEKFILEKDPTLIDIHKTFRLILKNGIIFTRMAPDHKALLVESFKKEKISTLMCGDGTNDCPALRKADVGVALSSEEASMASHFNYTKQDISCLYHLLKEGKCALSASIQTFKFMIMYCVLCYIAAIFLMYHSSNVSDMQGFFLDLFLIYPLEWFVSQTDPTDELTFHRPIDSLFSFPIILSLLGQFTISILFQYGGYYLLKKKFMWEDMCMVSEEGDPEPCPENTIIYIINQFQLIFSAITLYKSWPFRRSIFTNKILMLYLSTGILFTVYLTLFCNERIKYSFDLFDFEIYEEESKNNEEIGENKKRVEKHYQMINYFLIIISIINAIVNLLFEWVFVEIANKFWWERKNKKYKELIKNERKKGTERPYNIKNEVSIRNYINLYYHERRNKLKINEDLMNENFIDDNEDDAIELEDMTPNGKVIKK